MRIEKTINKQKDINFYELSFNGKSKEVVESYVVKNDYI